MVSTGLVIATPPGHFLMLAARSSLFRKKGLILTNGIGVVDEDYSGDDDVISLSLHNLNRGCVCHIKKGERLAQGIFVRISKPEFVEAIAMGESRGGWGSTGE